MVDQNNEDSQKIDEKILEYLYRPLDVQTKEESLSCLKNELEKLKEAGVDLNAKYNSGSNIILRIAGQRDDSIDKVLDTDLVKMLKADFEIDLNTQDNFYKYSALHHAVMNKDIEGVKLLIDLGIDKSLSDRYNMTAGEYAIKLNHYKFADIIYRESADEIFDNSVYNDDETGNACFNLTMMEYALSKGSDIDRKIMIDGRGQTVLEYAARNGNIEAAMFAVSHNAFLDQKNDVNLTPAEIAYDRGHGMLAESIDSAIIGGAHVNFPSEQLG